MDYSIAGGVTNRQQRKTRIQLKVRNVNRSMIYVDVFEIG